MPGMAGIRSGKQSDNQAILLKFCKQRLRRVLNSWNHFSLVLFAGSFPPTAPERTRERRAIMKGDSLCFSAAQ